LFQGNDINMFNERLNSDRRLMNWKIGYKVSTISHAFSLKKTNLQSNKLQI